MQPNGKKGKKKIRQQRALDRWTNRLILITAFLRDSTDSEKRSRHQSKLIYIQGQISTLKIKLGLENSKTLHLIP